MINPFRKSAIDAAKSSIFKGGVREKEALAKAAGSSGFSARKMDKTLKDSGYDPGKRKGIIDKISGKKETGLTKEQKTRNISASRQSAELGKTGYVSAEVSFGGQDIETRSRVALGQAGGGVKGTAQNRFGMGRGSVGFAGQKKSNNIPSNPPSKPSGGVKPAGL